MIFSILSRDEVHGYVDETHRPPRETQFDDRHRRLQDHGFACARTALSRIPQPAPDTPSNATMLCSSFSRNDVRRHDDETHAPWSVTHFVTPRRPQPAHGLTHDPPNSSGTPWGASDKLLQYSGTPPSPSSDNETHGHDETTTHRPPAEEHYDDRGYRPLFLRSSNGRAASTHASHPVPNKVQSTPSQAQEITKTPTSFPDSRIASTQSRSFGRFGSFSRETP